MANVGTEEHRLSLDHTGQLRQRDSVSLTAKLGLSIIKFIPTGPLNDYSPGSLLKDSRCKLRSRDHF